MTAEAATKTEELPSVPLDEVMLAMDVVDTLRHQRAQVEAELDHDKREQALIARVRSIYESQGMDVPLDVIAEGVKALVEDRFTYDPPDRTFQVRLAEIYVERGKWALRLFLVLLLGLAAWAAVAIPRHLKREGMIDEFRLSMQILGQRADELEGRTDRLATRVAGTTVPKSAAGAEILADAQRNLDESKGRLERLQSEIDPGPDSTTYPDEKERLDGIVAEFHGVIDRVTTDLGAVEGQLEALDGLKDVRAQAESALAGLSSLPIPDEERRDLEAMRAAVIASVDAGQVAQAWTRLRMLKSRVADFVRSHAERQNRVKELNRLTSRLRGMQLDAKTKAELDGLKSSVRNALDTNDGATASRDLARLGALVATLDRSYELRIATGHRKRSGVWRNTPGRKRNYYIIVEPIGPSGRRLSLRIKNEEDNRVERVSRFGVRVPKTAYDQVKADQADNGVIDNRLFGVKRRGSREIEYRFPVSGGMITRW